jgi:hypothetical protein
MPRAVSGVASREGWLLRGSAASGGRSGEATRRNGWAGASAWLPQLEGHHGEGSGEVMSVAARGWEGDAHASESRGEGRGVGCTR